jgi:hypothetical protein
MKIEPAPIITLGTGAAETCVTHYAGAGYILQRGCICGAGLFFRVWESVQVFGRHWA